MPLVFQAKQVTREIQDLVSKTEAGDVRQNLHDEGTVRQAFDDIQAQLARENKLDAMDLVIVQPMISAGVELMARVIGRSVVWSARGFWAGRHSRRGS